MSDDRFDEELRAGLHGLVDDAEPAPGFRERARLNGWGTDNRQRLIRWGSLVAAAAVVATLVGVVTLRHDGSSESRVATRPGPATSTSTAAEPAPVAGAAEATSTTTAVSTTTTAKKRVTAPPTTTKSPPSTSPTTWPPGPPRGTLAFVRGSPPAIFVMNADGTGLHQVGPSGAISPEWSPDGSRIAYRTMAGVFVMNSDGSQPRQVTAGTDNGPAWSPDGNQLVFSRARPTDPNNYTDYSDLYIVNADGSGLHQLTNDTSYNGDPKWSPDGSTIAFQRSKDGEGDSIYVIRPDGSGTARIVWVYGGTLTWSPDSKQIAYTPGTSGNSDVWVANRDGTGATRITDDQSHDFEPSWSPDGWIAYGNIGPPLNQGGQFVVILVRPDGSGRRTLAVDPNTDPDPAWRGAF